MRQIGYARKEKQVARDNGSLRSDPPRGLVRRQLGEGTLGGERQGRSQMASDSRGCSTAARLLNICQGTYDRLSWSHAFAGLGGGSGHPLPDCLDLGA
jgi:hypothetical protein